MYHLYALENVIRQNTNTSPVVPGCKDPITNAYELEDSTIGFPRYQTIL